MKRILALIIALTLIPIIPAFANSSTPTLVVDMTKPDHDILHGSAGFLYGISNEGVPDVNTLTPLKPKVLATKGALGTEHPYGDALDVADEFFQSGGEQVQMYNSNYYGVFGVTANAYDYGNVLETIIAPHVSRWKDSYREKYPDIDSRMVYIPINEGTPVNGVSDFNAAWKIYYNAIKASDPSAVIAGPNDAVYRGHNSMYNHLKFCRDNNCLPDIVTWHELQVGCLDTMDDHIADYRSICKQLGIEEKQVVINEYADYSDCGVPGRLVNWIARLEDNEVYGCLPFWHQANNLNDLTANANDGNGAWWVYKWYGDMSGKVLSLITKNTTFDRFYGLAAIDEAKQSATVIAGGNDGNGTISLKNIAKTSIFKNAKNVNVKVEASYFTGYLGASGEPETILEGVFPVIDGNVEITLEDMLFSTAYRVTITKTDASSPYFVKGSYRKLYEAEDALHYGNLITEKESSPIEKPRYFCSGRVRMGGFDEEGDGIGYKISVPHDGLYKLSFLYGNGVGSTRNNAQTHAPKNITQTLYVDSVEYELHLPNTLFYSMEGMVDKYVPLKKGYHTIKVMYSNEKGAFHDALYVSYHAPFEEAVLIYDKTFEAENADFNPQSSALTESEIPGFSSSGYVTALDITPVEYGGGIRHVVCVPQSGLYNIQFGYLCENEGSIRVFLDNTNLTFDNHLTDIEIYPSDTWKTAYTTVFLRQGLNIIDYDLTVPGNIDYMRVVAADMNMSTVYEAEDAQGSFVTAKSGNVTYVTPLLGDTNASDTKGHFLELKVTVPDDGLYKMQVFQSNDELCGTHSYNIKIIDRYASFMVNGDKENAKRYFFPNSFSEDTFLEKTIPLNLQEGENTIRIYNDDSWHVLWGGSTSEPGTNELVNYTPNFDKFIITPAVCDSPMRETGCSVNVSASDSGFIYTDKTYAEKGEKVTIYLIPEGDIAALTLNGKDILPTIKTNDNNIYYTSFTIQEDSEIIATFTPAIADDGIAVGNDDELISIDGEKYSITGENLYKNPTFSDNSGMDMEQWYVGSNTQGHPQSGTYKMPLINADGTRENLTPLTQSGYLTTGSFEKDGNNTFYYGYNGNFTYLVEHMASDWQHCAWNGNKSLLSFVPIKENTNYYFSFDAYTLSGKASVRFGAIDMDAGDNFYIPASYNTSESLNFTSQAFDCTNGDMQNIGGDWETYSLAFNSGEGADYFLFNAYWLQMAEYLCIGNFKLYELSDLPLTYVEPVSSLSAQVVKKGKMLSLPTSVESDGMEIPIEWLNPEIVDTASTGTYLVTGRLALPFGYYTDNNLISIRIIVTENSCEITDWSIDGGNVKLNVKCFDTLDATLISCTYEGDKLIKVVTQPATLIENTIVPFSVPYEKNSKVFIWYKDSVKPLCASKTIN